MTSTMTEWFTSFFLPTPTREDSVTEEVHDDDLDFGAPMSVDSSCFDQVFVRKVGDDDDFLDEIVEAGDFDTASYRKTTAASTAATITIPSKESPRTSQSKTKAKPKQPSPKSTKSFILQDSNDNFKQDLILRIGLVVFLPMVVLFTVLLFFIPGK